MSIGRSDPPAPPPPLFGPVARLMRVPAHIPEADRRVFFTRQILLLIAGSIHLTLIGLYAAFGTWWAVGVNVGSATWYVMVVAVLRAGWQRTAMILGFAEALAHGFAFTVLLGLSAGYVFYNFAFLTVAFLAYRAAEPAERYGLIGLSWLATVTEILVMRTRPPAVVLDPLAVEILGYLNIIGSLLAGIGGTAYFSYAVDRAEDQLNRALARSEKLLLNILPAPIADRLKTKPGTIADNFPSVTVLFADIVGFTPLSARLPGRQLVEILNDIFSMFDRSAERHRVEKIKTIGDAYMVVGGLPDVRDDHAGAVCEMALEMQAAVAAYSAATGVDINIRIGIHTGPVIAGVIGTKKFCYDLWGDTVNTASRMESHGLPGCIQVSDATYQLLSDRYRFADRGTITLKGKGEVRAWFLQGAAEPPTAAAG